MDEDLLYLPAYCNTSRKLGNAVSLGPFPTISHSPTETGVLISCGDTVEFGDATMVDPFALDAEARAGVAIVFFNVYAVLTSGSPPAKLSFVCSPVK